MEFLAQILTNAVVHATPHAHHSPHALNPVAVEKTVKTTVTVFSDVKVVIGSISGVIIFGMQVLTYVKQVQNGRAVKQTNTAVADLGLSDEDIKRQLDALAEQTASIAQTTQTLKGLIERRSTQTLDHPGRRVADTSMRPPPSAKNVGGLTPRASL